MDFQEIKELLSKEGNDKQLGLDEKQKLRDKVLSIKEFNNLRKQIGGDDKIFDECLSCLRYEFYQKNSLILHTGQKRERFYFILEGSCGQFQQKEDSNLNKEIKYFGIVQELSTNLKQQQSKLAKATMLEEEQLAIYNIKNLQQKISTAEATLFVYRKECDQQRLKEAIQSIEDKQLRSKLYQKHFQLNTLCLYAKEKTLISGDTIDQINLNGKDIKCTTITYEDSHILSISINDYSRIFQHIVKQIHQSQKIMRNYFPEINEETLQMLSYEFTTHYYERNEAIYHQNAANPQQFFILLSGSIEIRKYIDKNKKQLNCNSPQQLLIDHSNLNSQQQINSTTNTNNNNQINKQDLNSNSQPFKAEQDNDSNENQDHLKSNQTIKPKIEIMKIKEVNQQKMYTSNDPYHSIMIFSGMQVFGTECYAKINEYSAASVSTETKVISLDKKKFDLYDHQFNFKGFLKKQALVQNKFYQERLSRLEDFSKKILDEQIKSRQLIYTHAKHKTAVLTSNGVSSHNNLDTPNKNILKAGSSHDLEQQEGNNNVFDLQQRVQQQSIIQSLFQSQNGQNISFKDLIQKIIVSRNKQNEEEKPEEGKKELHYHQLTPRKIEHNKGFEFELNEDKKRRTNILIDYKVKKQLNYKSLPKKKSDDNIPQTPQKAEIQKQNRNSSNNNNNVVISNNNINTNNNNNQVSKGKQQYVQREGQFPWLDQFGFRKEMEASSNSMNLQQIANKMKRQDEIMKQLTKRNSQDASPMNSNRGRNSSLDKQQSQCENINNVPSLNELHQINEKQNHHHQQKSYVNLEVTNKHILRIKSSINIMREQDQQEQEQIQDLQKIFSTNRIYKSAQQLNNIDSNNTPKQNNQEIQTNLSQNLIANFVIDSQNNSNIFRSQSQNHISLNINSPTSQRIILDPLNTPDKSTQLRSKAILRKTKKYHSTIIKSHNNENPLKKDMEDQSFLKIQNDHRVQNEIQSLQIITPKLQKHKNQASLHLDQIKKEIPQIERVESTRQIRNQVNLLKKRNLIAENFSPSLNNKINTSQKLDNSPHSFSITMHQPTLTDRLLDSYKDSPAAASQFKRYSENIFSRTPSSCKTTFYKQSSQELNSPSNISSNFNIRSQSKGCPNIKFKVSNFVR